MGSVMPSVAGSAAWKRNESGEVILGAAHTCVQVGLYLSILKVSIASQEGTAEPGVTQHMAPTEHPSIPVRESCEAQPFSNLCT